VPPPPPPPAPEPNRTVTYLAFGVGGLGLIGGATTGIITMTMAPKLDCPDARCTNEHADNLRQARTLATISNVALAAGLAGVTLGAVSLIVPATSPRQPRAGKGTRLALRLGPASAALEGELP
jgi:hypothetical protein